MCKGCDKEHEWSEFSMELYIIILEGFCVAEKQHAYGVCYTNFIGDGAEHRKKWRCDVTSKNMQTMSGLHR